MTSGKVLTLGMDVSVKVEVLEAALSGQSIQMRQETERDGRRTKALLHHSHHARDETRANTAFEVTCNPPGKHPLNLKFQPVNFGWSSQTPVPSVFQE